MRNDPKEARHVLDKITGGDSELQDMIAEERVNFRVAQMIYDARKEAGLTQQGLAELVGTTQSVISQLESADYEGHSLGMLRRIAEALGKRVEISFAPASGEESTAQEEAARRP